MTPGLHEEAAAATRMVAAAGVNWDLRPTPLEGCWTHLAIARGLWSAWCLALFVLMPASTVWAAVSSWKPVGPEGGMVFSLAIAPDDPQTVYAGTYHGGVFKSTDGGGSWRQVNHGMRNYHVWALAVDPSNPETIYAGTAMWPHKSTDGGHTWTRLSLVSGYAQVLTLAIDPRSPQTIYSGG